jgi:hypothetical protein
VSESPILALMRQALAERSTVFADSGVSIEMVPLGEFASEGIRLDAQSRRGLAQAVLHESGDLSLVVADTSTHEVTVDDYRSVSSQLGICDLLETILAHLRTD